MKKLIIVFVALITIFSASVSAFASQTFVDWQIVDTFIDLYYNTQNCVIMKYNTASPSPSMVNRTGAIATQETTFNVLDALYETVTVKGANLIQNSWSSRYEWYEYRGYCWIRVIPDDTTNVGWIANAQGKILYCEAPDTETEYTFVGIAGATGYCQTDRPAGTTGGGYLGDLCVTQDNLITIHDVVSHLGGAADYYTVLRIVNGEYRYYIMCTYPNRLQYFVCNTSGQLFYALKDEPDSGGSDEPDSGGSGDGSSGDGGGSSFDATEVITAINSVYDVIDIGFFHVCNWLDAIQDNISSFNNDVLLMSQNMTDGFFDLYNVGSRINDTLIDINSGLFAVGDEIVYSIDYLRYKFVDYFDSLGQTYSKLVTVELSGEGDTLVWSKGNSVQSVEVSNMSTFGELSFFKGGSLGSSSWSIANSSDGYTTSYNSDTKVYDFVCVAPNGYDRYVTYNWVKNGDFSKLSAGSTLKGWSMAGGAGIVTVGDGFVNYTVTNPTKYNRLYYPLSIDFEKGRTYTVSVLCDINNLVGGNLTFRAGNGNSQLKCANASVSIPSTSVGTGIVLYTTTFTSDVLYSDARVEFLLSPDEEVDIDIYGVKVERVDYQSLAFEGYDGNWHFYTDVYIPPNLTFTVDGQSHQLTTGLSFCENRHDRIFYDVGIERWYVYRYSSGSSYELPTADQKILNNCFPYSVNGGAIKLESLNVSSFPLLEDGVYSVDVDGDAVVTVSYVHNGTWFEYMYLMMGMLYDRLDALDYGEHIDGVEGKLDGITTTLATQNGYVDGLETTLSNIYDRLGDIEDAVVSADNVIIDITTDNDAFNIFYITKTDGTTESVGDAAKDAAVFVGDVLSMFYRLIFADGLENADIIHDFEDVYTDNNVGVSVW